MNNYIKYIQIPINKILFDHYSSLNLNEKSLIILLRLIENGQNEFKGFESLIDGTTMNKNEAIKIVQELIQLNLLDVETKKVDNKRVETYTFDTLYKKLEKLVDGEPLDKEVKDSDIQIVFQYIESLYGRALSPAEFERITEWMTTDHYDTDTIKNGVNIAFKNNITSLSYVERILSSLKKKQKDENYLKPKNWLSGEE